ncbi:MAG: hypothetical protein D4R88_07910 [Methanosarcinales archaeon]|nr:MAG: hypothetical protein D4R88_07910 [Methanosarcinales archaeon]
MIIELSEKIRLLKMAANISEKRVYMWFLDRINRIDRMNIISFAEDYYSVHHVILSNSAEVLL